MLLGELPEHLRTVFVLREAEQCDYESIAAVLGVPIGTVRSRLHRVREALKDGLRTRFGLTPADGVCSMFAFLKELSIGSRHSPAGWCRHP